MENQETVPTLPVLNGDSLKDSGGEKDTGSKSSPGENCPRESSENADVSSGDGCNLNSRFDILTIISLGADQAYAFLLPVLCDRDSMQLASSPPLLFRFDQQNGQRRAVRNNIYSANSFSSRNFGGSHAHRQFRGKGLQSKGTGPSDFPGSSSHSSLASFDPSTHLPNGSSSGFLSDTSRDTPKEHKPVKKNSKRKSKKKGKKKRKFVKESSSTKAKANSEEVSHESSISETCGNDVSNPCGTIKEVSVERDTCEKGESEGCSDGTVDHSETFVDMSGVPTPYNQKFSRDHPILSSGYWNQAETSEFSICNEVEDMKSCSDTIHSGGLSDMHDLAQDSISIGSISNHSSNCGQDVETSHQDNSEISLSYPSEINIKKGHFSTRNWLDGVVYTYNNHEESKNAEDNDDSSMQWIVAGRRGKKNKTVSRGFSGGRRVTLHGRSGKDNNHTVWKRVEKRDTAECQSELKEVNSVCSSIDHTSQEVYSLKRSRTHVETNMSKNEDAMLHKGETFSNLGRGINGPKLKDSYYTHVRSNVQQDEMPDISSVVTDNPVISRISVSWSECTCLAEGSVDKKNQGVTAGSGHSLQFSSAELDPPKSGSKSVSTINADNSENHFGILPDLSDTSSDLSSPCDAGSLPYLPHLICRRAAQREKGIPHTEFNKQSTFPGSMLQKWVPVGIKNCGLQTSDRCEPLLENQYGSVAEDQTEKKTTEVKVASDFQNIISSSVNGKDFPCDDDSQREKLGNNESFIKNDPNDEQNSSNSSTTTSQSEDLKFYSADSDFNKIAEAIKDVFRVQISTEDIQIATGSPIAEFEKLLHLFSPVICHKTTNISLGCLWKWYEPHGYVGLEVRAKDYQSTRRFGTDRHSFRAYFVPYLSAVQLFRKHENWSVKNRMGLYDKVFNTSDDDTSGNTSVARHLPIYSVLVPPASWPHADSNHLCSSDPGNNSFDNGVSVQSHKLGWSSDSELIFEYFESNQPQQRRSMYEKIEDLVRGDQTSKCKVFGDPTDLFSTKVQDLHPRSWYAVAWYPIYRIPDDSLRAAFLTYHSFGHLVKNIPKLNSPTASAHISSPVVGLQSYNAQDECWFQLSPDARCPKTGTGLDTSVVLKERLRTLEKTACLMSRAYVQKGTLSSSSVHPDFEFFVSRKR